MSQTLVLDTDVPRVVDTTSSQILDQERKVSKQRQKQPKASMPAAGSSILAAILSTLLLRIAGRTSFVLLGFYLGEHFTSATIVALVLEAFYISELVLAPIVGSLSMLRHKRIFTFLPAWLSINALVGAWITLSIIMLTYPEPAAAIRHPGQLL